MGKPYTLTAQFILEMYPPTKTDTLALTVKWCVKQIDGQTASNLIGNFLHSLDAGAIEVVLVPSCLDEQVGLDVPLHLFHARNKVVVSPVYLSLTRLTCRVCREGLVSSQKIRQELLF